MDGFLNLLKPPGMTSSDAVLFVRKRLPRGTRVGHCGTLDPEAAGVLPIAVGKATRLFDYVVDKRKEYVAEALFGVETDTQDVQGRVLRQTPAAVSARDVAEALPRLTGEIGQVPPMYSAIQTEGKRLYDLARQGKQVDLAPRTVRVDAFEALEWTAPDRCLFRIACGKGVYVRTLIHDLGRALGCGAAMSFLLRTQAGPFGLADAWTVEETAACEDLSQALRPLDWPLMHLPSAEVPPAFEKRARCGNPFPAEGQIPAGPLRVYLGGAFAGIGEGADGGTVRFRAMLLADGCPE